MSLSNCFEQSVSKCRIINEKYEHRMKKTTTDVIPNINIIIKSDPNTVSWKYNKILKRLKLRKITLENNFKQSTETCSRMKSF